MLADCSLMLFLRCVLTRDLVYVDRFYARSSQQKTIETENFMLAHEQTHICEENIEYLHAYTSPNMHRSVPSDVVSFARSFANH